MLAVEQAARLHGRRVVIVEAAGVDTVILRIGARLIEGVDAAMAAEGVLRRAGIELIDGQIVGAAQDFETVMQHRQVQDALLGADRAIAFPDRGFREIDLYAKAHLAAMAAAFISLEHGLGLRAVALSLARGGRTRAPGREFRRVQQRTTAP